MLRRSSYGVGFSHAVVMIFAVVAYADDLRKPTDDYATVTAERYFASGVSTPGLTAAPSFQNVWAYLGLPGFRAAGKNVFSAVEIDALWRDIRSESTMLDRSPMVRVGVFGGVTLFEGTSHRGSLMLGTGVASDTAFFHKNATFVHLIYDERLRVSETFSWGVGIQFLYELGRWASPPVNLLPTVNWMITPNTNLKIAWDNLELRQIIVPRCAAVGELRYDNSFFRLGDRTAVEFTTVAVGAGIDVWLVKDFYARIRYQELVYRREQIEQPNAPALDDILRSGRSIKLSFVYAK